MAGAYGGQAVGSIRRPGIKYDKERLEGSKKFRVQTADEEKVRAQLNQLIKSQSNATALKLAGSNDGINSRGQALMSGTGKRSDSRSKQRNGSGRGVDSRARVNSKNEGGNSKRGGLKDGDFEQMFGNDIDKFLENSEWDIESMDKVSHNSRDSAGSRNNEKKLKQMERLYLKRLEA